MKGRVMISLKDTVSCIAARQAVLAGLAGICTLLAGCNAGDAVKSLVNAETGGLAGGLTSNTYTVGGTVTGLSGHGLVLEDNGSDQLSVTTNGSFTFATALAVDANYSVSVKTQPSSPAQTCTLSKGSGIIGAANVTNVEVSCTTNATGASSGVGTPITDAVSQTIDASGGSLSSGDGRLTVTIPANALSAATSITIQPISNEAPGGIGLAYRLGPPGQTFATPVTITLHYAAPDLAGTSSSTLSLAYQDAQQQWNVYQQPHIDDTAQTVSVSSSHFSDWSLLTGGQLLPANATVETGETVALNFVECQRVQDGLLVSLMAACSPQPAGAWAVNGVLGGNSAVGTIAAGSGLSATGTYTAPATVPASNPVAVSTDALIAGLTKTKEIFVSNITVVPQCTSSSSDCTWTGTTTFSGEFHTVTTQTTWHAVKDDQGQLLVQLVSGTASFATSQPGCTLSFSSESITAANLEPTDGWTIGLEVTPTPYYGSAWLESGLPTETCPATPHPVDFVWQPTNFLHTGPPFSPAPSGATLKGSYQDSGGSWSWDLQRTN